MGAERDVIFVVYCQPLRQPHQHPAVGRGSPAPTSIFKSRVPVTKMPPSAAAVIQGHRKRDHPVVVYRRQSELIENAAAEVGPSPSASSLRNRPLL